MSTGLFIAGQWKQGQPLEVRNKYNGAVIGSVATASLADVDAAVASAAHGAATMSSLPAHQRAKILLAVAERLLAKKEELARTIAAEAGKSIKLARGEAFAFRRDSLLPRLPQRATPRQPRLDSGPAVADQSSR